MRCTYRRDKAVGEVEQYGSVGTLALRKLRFQIKHVVEEVDHKRLGVAITRIGVPFLGTLNKQALKILGVFVARRPTLFWLGQGIDKRVHRGSFVIPLKKDVQTSAKHIRVNRGNAINDLYRRLSV